MKRMRIYPLAEVDSYLPINKDYTEEQAQEFISRFIVDDINKLSDLLSLLYEIPILEEKDIAFPVEENIIKNTPPVPSVEIEGCHDLRWHLVCAIEEYLRKCPNKKYDVNLLISLLQAEKSKEEEREIDRAVVYALGKIGHEAKRAIPYLISSFKKGNLIAGNAMIRIGDAGIFALVQLLDHPEDDIRSASASVLGEIFQKSDSEFIVLALVKALKDSCNKVRLSAKSSLERIREDSICSIEVLIECLCMPDNDSDDSFSCKENIADAIGEIGAAVVLFLIPLLSNPQRNIRFWASFALWKIGMKTQSAQTAIVSELTVQLHNLLNCQDEKDQLLAAITLAKIGAAEPENVLPMLIPAIIEEEHFVRDEVISAIRSLGDSILNSLRFGELVSNLIATLKYRNVYSYDYINTICSSEQFLIQLGKHAVPFLVSAFLDENITISARISFIITEIGSAAIPDLIESLQDDNLEVRRRSAFVLSKIGGDAVNELTMALNKNDTHGVSYSYTRQGAIYALGMANLLSRNQVELLKNIIEDETRFFDERRIAASMLDVMKEDVVTFFKKNNLVSPVNAACPVNFKFNQLEFSAEFDIYTGKCLMSCNPVIKQYAACQHALLPSIINGLWSFFCDRK